MAALQEAGIDVETWRQRHEDGDRRFDKDQARHLLEETQLYIEAAHACNARLLEQRQAALPPSWNVAF